MKRVQEVVVQDFDNGASASGFSIVVCAYNAESRIEPTLRHLARLRLPSNSDAEVILVDNASTDRTTFAAEAVWIGVGQPFPLRILREPSQGLAYARRTGVLAARFPYAVFCDDDNWLDAGYLVLAHSILASHAAIGVVGGCSTPIADVELPPWFYTRSAAFAVGVQADSDGDITHRKFVWGAGMVFRTQPLKRIYLGGQIPLTIGRSGVSLGSGDDAELCAWFIFCGYRLYYSSELRFKHHMACGRLSEAYSKELLEQHQASFSRRYSAYLTVRYFLGVSGNSRESKLRRLAKYVFSAGQVLLHAHDSYTIWRVDRDVRRTAGVA